MFPGYNLWEGYSQLVEVRKREDKSVSLSFSFHSVICVDRVIFAKSTFCRCSQRVE